MRLVNALVLVLGAASIAACSNTVTGEPSGSSGSSGTPTRPSDDGGTEQTGDSGSKPPPASGDEVAVDIGGSCPAFTACGGNPQGTYDYTEGCVEDVFAQAKKSCPTLDATNAKVSVKGSLQFVGSALTRNSTVKTSGSISIPVSCSQGQCALVESALAAAFDSVKCTGAAACTCTIEDTATVSNATTFTVSGDTVTTADGETYSICEQSGTLRYKGKSAGSEDGHWALKKR